MNSANSSTQASLGPVVLAVLALAALWLLGMPFFFEDVRLLSGLGLSSAPYRLATWGNTLIAASTVLYVANLRLSLDGVGRWATRLAGAGAAVLVVDIGADLLVFSREPPGNQDVWLLSPYDVISTIVPVAVIWHLVIERLHRWPGAGAYVMWAILCFIGVEMWLAAASTGASRALISAFHGYWGEAYLVAHVIGYGAFVMAAAAGILYLARCHLDAQGVHHPFVTRWLPDSWKARIATLSAIGVGVPVFALALFLALGWAFGADPEMSFAWLKGLWVAGVLAFYGAFLYLLVTRIVPARDMAWWTVIGLGLTLAGFLATHMLSQDVAATPSGAGSSRTAAAELIAPANHGGAPHDPRQPSPVSTLPPPSADG